MSMLVNEFNETDLVGKNAYPLYSKIGATVEVVNPAIKSGIIKWRLGEVAVRRHGVRSWEILAGDQSIFVYTQWELWAWISDRV